MKNTDFLKEMNKILDNSKLDNYSKVEEFKRLKDKIIENILKEENTEKNKSLKNVYTACMKILKYSKTRPVFQKAIKRNDYLEFTDAYSLVRFLKEDYINLPIHEENANYPSFDTIFKGVASNDFEITLNENDIINKYKLFKASKDKNDFKNRVYTLFENENVKINVDIDRLKDMLDIFSCEKEYKVLINEYTNRKPIVFKSDNIQALLLPLSI